MILSNSASNIAGISIRIFNPTNIGETETSSHTRYSDGILFFTLSVKTIDLMLYIIIQSHNRQFPEIPPFLLHRNTLRQIPGEINVKPVFDGQVITQELHGDDVQHSL